MNCGSRHSGKRDEFNADFAPATMGYNPAKTIYNGGFETFCVEENEYFTPGSTYNYGISQKAVNRRRWLVPILIPFRGERRGST